MEYSSKAAFVLWDKDGEFLIVPVVVSTTEAMPEITEHEGKHSSEESEGELDDMEALCQTVADITTKRDALQMQLQEVTQVLEQKKARIKELWRMSCGQAEEYDTTVVAKDNEIAALKAQLRSGKVLEGAKPGMDNGQQPDVQPEPEVRCPDELLHDMVNSGTHPGTPLVSLNHQQILCLLQRGNEQRIVGVVVHHL